MQRRPGAREMLESMAAAEGITLGTPPIIANSHKAFELAEFAREQGAPDPIHRALFYAYFTEGRNIGDLDVLVDVAGRVGLVPDAARDALIEGRYVSEVDERIGWARDLGISSTPTFVFDERYAVVGAQEYPAFEQVMDRLGHAKISQQA
jgi:predicted DsbA family dithiol-disulfide isomerase